MTLEAPRRRGRPSKGARVRVGLHVSPSVRAALEAYRVAEGLDGMAAVIEELVALRGDRDEELVAARRERRVAEEGLQAALAVAGETERENRRLRAELLRAGARRGRRRVASSAPSSSGGLPAWLLDVAARTPCSSCEGMMDPGGLRAGERQCGPCRGAGPPRPEE